MTYINELVADCIQFERAFCTSECPFNLDVHDFIGKLQQGRFNVAYRTYQYAVGFPGIVTALCDEPCKLVCPMKDAGGAISLRMLEKAAIDYARNKEPDQYNMPPKDKKIAIIGAGISGLACALKLTTRKYQVTVFERSDKIGGHLHDLLSPEIFLNDIQLQFRNEEYTLHLNTEILSLSNLDFDAFYIATGRGGIDLKKNTVRKGVFSGGSLRDANTMEAMADGLNISGAIESFLKTAIMNQALEIADTKLILEAIRVIPGDTVIPANGDHYLKEEALLEAKRCLKCACDACVHYSPLMNYFKKFPRRITEEVEVTIQPSSLDGNATLATRMISTCNHCGLCKEVCPVNIDVGEFLLQSHRTMHQKGAMPWVFHEFFLRDMEFTNGEAALTRLPYGCDKSRYMFFPGCQLGASDPRYVTESYRFLTKHFPDMSLMLNCCGAPAEWAGDEQIHSKAINQIREGWIKLGKPKAIFACLMCRQMFRRYLPEIEGEFLYIIMDKEGIMPMNPVEGLKASVFDPCASRNEPLVQQTVRKLAKRAGFDLESLPMEGKMAECCSYGGQVSITHPPFTNQAIQQRIHQNDLPYITYCSNCRDIFAGAGKKAWHILDIMLGFSGEQRSLPTISERRINRLQLKKKLLEEFWKEKISMEKSKKELIISRELKEKLDKEFILETDVKIVIEYCEESGKKLFDPDKKSFSGHMQIGNMTYWVEYRSIKDSGFELNNAYAHRMKVEEE
jgi:Fe-S oxidoreductase